MKHVYFIQRRDREGPIKIGCSEAPQSRLRVFADWSPYVLDIIAYAPGGFDEENALHRHFERFRIHGEWFEPNPELLAIIARINASGSLPDIALDLRSQEMAHRYIAGETLQSIAADFDITRERVRQILRKAGVPSQGFRPQHMSRPRSTAEDRAERCVELLREGKTLVQIAEAVGDYVWNVRTALARRGHHSPRKGPPIKESTKVRAEIAAQMYNEGATSTVIAARLGIPQPSIYRLLHMKGVTPNRGRGRKPAHVTTPDQAKAA